MLGQKNVCKGNNPFLLRSEIGMLVDKERIKIDERTLYAHPPSLVLRDAVGVVNGQHLPSLRMREENLSSHSVIFY